MASQAGLDSNLTLAITVKAYVSPAPLLTRQLIRIFDVTVSHSRHLLNSISYLYVLFLGMSGLAHAWHSISSWQTLAFLTVSVSLASDLGVALALVVVLFRSRTGIRRYFGRSSFFPRHAKELRRTDSLIHTLMMYTINTGLLVAYVSIILFLNPSNACKLISGNLSGRPV